MSQFKQAVAILSAVVLVSLVDGKQQAIVAGRTLDRKEVVKLANEVSEVKALVAHAEAAVASIPTDNQDAIRWGNNEVLALDFTTIRLRAEYSFMSLKDGLYDMRAQAEYIIRYAPQS